MACKFSQEKSLNKNPCPFYIYVNLQIICLLTKKVTFPIKTLQDSSPVRQIKSKTYMFLCIKFHRIFRWFFSLCLLWKRKYSSVYTFHTWLVSVVISPTKHKTHSLVDIKNLSIKQPYHIHQKHVIDCSF